jgi:hypothetical protein
MARFRFIAEAKTSYASVDPDVSELVFRAS